MQFLPSEEIPQMDSGPLRNLVEINDIIVVHLDPVRPLKGIWGKIALQAQSWLTKKAFCFVFV